MIQSEAFAMERVDHIQMVKISSREDSEIETYRQMQQEVVACGKRASWAKGMFMGFMFSASSAALVAIFQVGGKDVANGRLTHGQLKSFATYTFMLGLGTSGVMKGMSAFLQGMLSVERLYDVLLDDEDEHNYNNKEEIQKPYQISASDVHAISMDHVSFHYASSKDPSSTPVLQDISLKIQRGEVVALCGANGAGKSTLASILVALYHPTSGSIYVHTNGENKDVLDLCSLDRKVQSQLVQLVPQEPSLFDITIEDNVKYANPTASPKDVEDVLKAADCTGFLSKWNDGMRLIVGKNGEKLSGGQKQRVALARALLSNPALLILDEPASSMDAEGDEAVSDAVKACRDGNSNKTKRGLLLISHRASSLQLADRVIVLKDGKIVEEGTYHSLAKNKKSALCQLMPELQ